jgi:hypothetical protein
LCGSEAWSLTLKKDLRLSGFENRVLRKVFGSKKEKILGGSKRLYDEEIYNIFRKHYYSDQIKEN